MDPNCDRYQDNQQADEGFDLLPALSGDGNANPNGGRKDHLMASEVMDLAFEVTRTSAEIYEMISDMAEWVQGSSNQYGSMGSPERQRQLAALLRIVGATETTEMRLRLLDSETITERPEILERFFKDCWAALLTFRAVCGRLAEIIGLDGWEKPSATASESLAQIMKQLETCSEKVSDLPGSGLAVSSQCLARTALYLQRQAGKLAEKAASHS